MQHAIDGNWDTGTLKRNINTKYLGRILEVHSCASSIIIIPEREAADHAKDACNQAGKENTSDKPCKIFGPMTG